MAGESFVDYFSEDGGVGGGIAATGKSKGPGSWRKEYPHSRTGTSLPLCVDAPSISTSAVAAEGAGTNSSGLTSNSSGIPPLQLVWKGDEPLDKLHVAFRVSVPRGNQDAGAGGGSVSKSDKHGKDKDKEKKSSGSPTELHEGHCATGLEKLCKLALCAAADHGDDDGSSTGPRHVHVKTSIAQLLLKDGVPMYNIDPSTLQVCVHVHYFV